MSASSIATKWEEILPHHQDAAALHMNVSELAVYEQAQQILTQSAAAERDLWTRMRERKKPGSAKACRSWMRETER